MPPLGALRRSTLQPWDERKGGVWLEEQTALFLQQRFPASLSQLSTQRTLEAAIHRLQLTVALGRQHLARGCRAAAGLAAHHDGCVQLWKQHGNLQSMGATEGVPFWCRSAKPARGSREAPVLSHLPCGQQALPSTCLLQKRCISHLLACLPQKNGHVERALGPPGCKLVGCPAGWQHKGAAAATAGAKSEAARLSHLLCVPSHHEAPCVPSAAAAVQHQEHLSSA